MNLQQKRVILAAVVGFAVLAGGIAVYRHGHHAGPGTTAPDHSAAQDDPSASSAIEPGATVLYAHNLRLRQGPLFRVYIRWIRGQMLRTRKDVIPSFDDPESFVLRIDKGVIHVNIGDVAGYLNASSPKDAPLKNITMVPDGELMKLNGTLHKLVPLSIELTGKFSPMPDSRIRFHVTKLNVLKIPMKGLLGAFHVELADLMHSSKVPGVEIADNDLLFDTEKLAPPPHIRGPITSVEINGPDLEVIYGGAKNDETKLSQWHNFLKLTGGTLDFGKLTMRDVDLTMIDASQDPWFDLDLVHYQQQLVNGYERMTPQEGLEIFMPDVDEKTIGDKTISMEWLKNRNAALPVGVPH